MGKVRAILAFLTLFIGLVVVSPAQTLQTKQHQVQQQAPYVYRDLGAYKHGFPDGSSIGIHAYILKGANNSGYYTQYKNVFILVAESTSVYGGQYKATWLYGTRVFMNGVETTAQQYPTGYTAYVKLETTVIYSWYTNDEDVGKYYFSWESSAYEIR